MLEKSSDGKLRWTHVTHLYREFGNLIAVIKAMLLAFFIAFAIVLLISIWGIEFRTFLSLCNVWGMIFIGVVALSIMGFYLWGWANGGLYEREYLMDEIGLECKRIVHKPWRMKLLRAITWVVLLMPGKASQKLILRRIVFDTDKPLKMYFSKLSDVSGNEAKGTISVNAGEGLNEIFVPKEDYAEVMAFLTSLLDGKNTRKRRSSKRSI